MGSISAEKRLFWQKNAKSPRKSLYLLEKYNICENIKKSARKCKYLADICIN